MIADTILIKEDENEILTKNLSSEWEEISYNLDNSFEEDEVYFSYLIFNT